MITISDHQVCLLLGSNIQPERNLPIAIDQLQNYLTILRISSTWETPALGPGGPSFLNAALLAKTPLEQMALKVHVLIPLEEKMGRVRSADKCAHYPINLDIVLFDGLCLDQTLRRFPHRAVPMADIQPEIRLGAGQTLKETAAKFMPEGSIRLRPDVVLWPSVNTRND